MNTNTTNHFFPEGLPQSKAITSRQNKPKTKKSEDFSAIEFLSLGPSPFCKTILDNLKRAASLEAPVLIVGESGSGKEVAARCLHDFRVELKRLNKSDSPFVASNAATIPDELAESLLFGHERGAFTSARERQYGRLESAKNGTFFLDDIQNLSLAVQAKLLRTIERREFDRLGSKNSLSLDCQMVFATNIPLEILVERHRFRKDLYYRMNIVPIYLTSLRQRKEDLPSYISYFQNRILKKYGLPIQDIEPEAYEFLLNHKWSGNLRELEFSLLYSAIRGGSTLNVKGLAPWITGELQTYLNQGKWDQL